ncbi:MAG: hypothetical protein QNJ65_05470 [Xenococcaceae cyanobacterium MO_234.B1]|nr:hypothetical protein [Xenococcaceae cyanobacterium MO_234.B1]
MRRRTFSRQNTDVELFPFLSILACTIGTLILLIIVLTSQALDKQEVRIVARNEGEKGINESKNPRYIECRKDGVILHPSKIFVPQEELQSPNSPLQELIKMIKINRNTEYLIIAVRPNGIDVFNQVRTMVQGAEIDIGYEPLDAGWQLVTGEETSNETQK